jgi:phosphatidylserine/phosphatidylglycerophosphate/cardiolipin synthase-like enzyme
MRSEKRIGYRPVYKTYTPLLRWKKKWEYFADGAAAHWIKVLGGTRRGDGLYEVRNDGKTYLMAKKTWGPMYVLVKKPVYGDPVKVFSHRQKYVYWVNVAVDVFYQDDDRAIGKSSRYEDLPRNGYDMGLTFNEDEPACPGEECDRIKQRLMWLIKNTPGPDPNAPNGTGGCEEIRVAAFALEHPGINRELADAVKRCVRVKILHNGKKAALTENSPYDADQLYTALDEAGRLGDYRRCPPDAKPDGSGPRGACASEARTSIMHSKYFLFTKTWPGSPDTGPDDPADLKPAVWFGSANMTKKDENVRADNTVVVYGHGTFYRRFREQIWDRMWARKPYKENQRRFEVGNDFTVEASPIPDDEPDPFKHALRNVNPRECEIRLMQAEWRSNTRKDVADRVRDLGLAGCAVSVMTGRAEGPLSNNTYAKKELCRVKPERRLLLEVGGVHDKVLIATWREPGKDGGYKNVVVTGSHNLTQAARKANDELLVEIRNMGKVYEAYELHWRRARRSDSRKVRELKC